MKTYTPLFTNGLYVDNMDLFERGKPGHTHLCECRQNNDAFFNRSAFMNHIKLKCHQKWLLSLKPPIISLEPPVTLIDVPLPITSLEPPISEEDIVPLTLKEEQDSEYERSLSKDRQKKIDKQEEEMRRVIQESEKAYIKEMVDKQKSDDLHRKRIIVKENRGYSFRFIFPNGKRASFNIPEEQEITYMRNYIDVYMEDNYIKIENYNMFIYPNKTLDEDDKIKDILENKTTIFIRSLEN